MRGANKYQDAVWSYVSAEQRIPADHPLRAIRKMVDEVLDDLSPHLSRLYSRFGRPSVAPEKLLRALLLQVLYSIRSERQLMEQLDYNLLYRWFVGLAMDDPIWDATVFSKNRRRLLDGEVAQAFFERVLEMAKRQQLLSEEHFSVDGTLLEAWASQKSFQKKEGAAGRDDDDRGNPSVDFHGEQRTNATHQSTTDPQARLYRKGPGKEARLCYMGHVLTENAHGLVVDTRVTMASGTAEVEAAQEMVGARRRRRRITVGGDKKYDQHGFVRALREMGVTPHVAQNRKGRRSAIDGRTTGRPGYQVSQRKRKLVEQLFGWLKTVGPMRRVKHRGLMRVAWMFTFTAAVYNVVRMVNLAGEAAA
jgi:transposase